MSAISNNSDRSRISKRQFVELHILHLFNAFSFSFLPTVVSEQCPDVCNAAWDTKKTETLPHDIQWNADPVAWGTISRDAVSGPLPERERGVQSRTTRGKSWGKVRNIYILNTMLIFLREMICCLYRPGSYKYEVRCFVYALSPSSSNSISLKSIATRFLVQ